MLPNLGFNSGCCHDNFDGLRRLDARRVVCTTSPQIVVGRIEHHARHRGRFWWRWLQRFWWRWRKPRRLRCGRWRRRRVWRSLGAGTSHLGQQRRALRRWRTVYVCICPNSRHPRAKAHASAKCRFVEKVAICGAAHFSRKYEAGSNCRFV